MRSGPVLEPLPERAQVALLDLPAGTLPDRRVGPLGGAEELAERAGVGAELGCDLGRVEGCHDDRSFR